MMIFRVVVPGHCIKELDFNWSREAERLIVHLEQNYIEANLALNLFIQAQASTSPELSFGNAVETADRKAIIRLSLTQELNLDPADTRKIVRDYLEYKVEERFQDELHAEGKIPRTFQHAMSFMYAKSFISALDGFYKVLDILAKDSRSPEAIPELYKQFSQVFSDLRGVRNSIQHLEDRVRRLGKGGKNFTLKPFSNDALSNPHGNVLDLGCLFGDRFCMTTADGSHGEIPITIESMEELRSIFQGVLASFTWDLRGSQRYIPS